jgi:hypothetical protein
LVEGFVAEHGVEDVTASSGEADEGGVVFLAFGSDLGKRVRVVLFAQCNEVLELFDHNVRAADYAPDDCIVHDRVESQRLLVSQEPLPTLSFFGGPLLPAAPTDVPPT